MSSFNISDIHDANFLVQQHDLLLPQGYGDEQALERKVWNPIFGGRVIELKESGEIIISSYSDRVKELFNGSKLKAFFFYLGKFFLSIITLPYALGLLAQRAINRIVLTKKFKTLVVKVKDAQTKQQQQLQQQPQQQQQQPQQQQQQQPRTYLNMFRGIFDYSPATPTSSVSPAQVPVAQVPVAQVPVAQATAAQSPLLNAMTPATRVNAPLEFDRTGRVIIPKSIPLTIYPQSASNLNAITILKAGAYQAAQIFNDEIQSSGQNGLVVMGTAGNSMLPGGMMAHDIRKNSFDSTKIYKTHEENVYVVLLQAAAMKIIGTTNLHEQKQLVRALYDEANAFSTGSARLGNRRYKNIFIEKYLQDNHSLQIFRANELVKLAFDATVDGRWGAVETHGSKDLANEFEAYHGDRRVNLRNATDPTVFSACVTHSAVIPKIDLTNPSLDSFNKAAAAIGARSDSDLFKVVIANGASANANSNAGRSARGTSKRSFNVAASNKSTRNGVSDYHMFRDSAYYAQLGKFISGAMAGGTHYIAEASGAGIYAPYDKVGGAHYKDVFLRDYPQLINGVMGAEFVYRGNIYKVGQLYQKVTLVDIPLRVQGKQGHIPTTNQL